MKKHTLILVLSLVFNGIGLGLVSQVPDTWEYEDIFGVDDPDAPVSNSDWNSDFDDPWPEGYDDLEGTSGDDPFAYPFAEPGDEDLFDDADLEDPYAGVEREWGFEYLDGESEAKLDEIDLFYAELELYEEVIQEELDAEKDRITQYYSDRFFDEEGFYLSDEEIFIQYKNYVATTVQPGGGSRIFLVEGEVSAEEVVMLDSVLIDTAFTVSKMVGRYFNQVTIQNGLSSPLVDLRQLNPRYAADRTKLESSRSVLGLIHEENLDIESESTFRINGNFKHGEVNGLCRDERFWNQPTATFCTGFLIDPQTLLTAGHCLEGVALEDIRFIHGFEATNDRGDAQLTIPERNVYRAEQVLQSGTLADFDIALIQLDRPASTRKPVTISENTAVGNQIPVYSIGYPSGLPVKLSRYGRTLDEGNPYYFFATLEAYRASSGSPVFNSLTHEVEGILLGGISDFWSTGGCNRTTTCKGGDCKGERILRLSILKDQLVQ